MSLFGESMAILHKKLLRDLLHTKGQSIAIALVLACGVASFVAMRSMYRSLLVSQRDYYAAYRFADIFSELKRAPNSVAVKLRSISGVARAEPRLVMDVTLDVPGMHEPAVGRLISIPDRRESSLNALFLKQGRYILPEAQNEVIASEAFATANNLRVGDGLSAIIGGRYQHLRIVGIALSPEYIYEIRGEGGIFPDNMHFGVLWMSAHALEAALNMKGAFNSVSVSLQPNANEQHVVNAMDRILARYGSLGAYGRDDQVSNRFISDEIAQNRISATVVPAIFLGVAALLVHLSFTRLVNMQRSEIAVIKAFGYPNWKVGVHFVEFSLAIGAIGYVLGCAVGWYFGIRLASLYAEFYRFPILTYRADGQTFVWAGLITATTAVAGAITAVARATLLPPAEAMRAEVPPQFRARMVDRLDPAWTTPASRMMLRNLERTPLRAVASGFAICCSIMIVVVEFGMLNALDSVLKIQFDDIQREDTTVTLNEPHSQSAELELSRLPGVLSAEAFRTIPIKLRYDHRFKNTSMMGLPRDGELRQIVDKYGRRVPLPSSGLLISRVLASALHLHAGDVVRVEFLEGRRFIRDLRVGGIVDDLLGMNVYVDLDDLNRLLEEDHVISGALLKVDPEKSAQLYTLLKSLPSVSAVSIKSAALKSSRDTIDRSMRMSLGTLLIFASIIAVAVIYNGARIALSERARELATLRVLGFSLREITFILLGEQSIINLCALPFGFMAGYSLCSILASRLQTELYRMPLVVEPASYVWAFLIVLAASVVSALLVHRRIASLDIVSVLKARE